MSINVDARGLSCPQPVIATKRALDSITSGVVTTIVDNVAARENVLKFAAANHCKSSVSEKNGHYYLTITKGREGLEAEPAAENDPKQNRVVYLISQNTLGHGSPELGAVLMKSFFYTLTESNPLPDAILFINSGVQLTVDGSPVQEHLQYLAERDVSIMSCGTCLDYYELKEKLAVGEVTNMFAIVERLAGASRVVTL